VVRRKREGSERVVGREWKTQQEDVAIGTIENDATASDCDRSCIGHGEEDEDPVVQTRPERPQRSLPQDEARSSGAGRSPHQLGKRTGSETQ